MNAKQRALRKANVFLRAWWLLKKPYWYIKVRICPWTERRHNCRVASMKEANAALRQSLMNMTIALQKDDLK
jgi:hypothetical protein